MISHKFLAPVLLTLVLGGVSAHGAQAQAGTLSPSAAFGKTTTPETTASGTIQQIITTAVDGSPAGLQLIVETAQGTLNVSVGPYLPKATQSALATGQQIQVAGMTQVLDGQSYLLARQLTLSGSQITIRNDRGFLVHTLNTESRSQRKQGGLNGEAQ